MLIDLDLAKEISSGRSGARHQTGTTEFMAIQVLRNVSHTYRQALESFFYVLLWICGRRAWNTIRSCFQGPPKQSRLTKRYMGSYDDIADAKEHHMGVSGFKDILKEFPQTLDCVKPLCRETGNTISSKQRWRTGHQDPQRSRSVVWAHHQSI